MVNKSKDGKAENDNTFGAYIVIIKMTKDMAILAEINKSTIKVGSGTIIKQITATTMPINIKSACLVTMEALNLALSRRVILNP